jgi:hypothetical protein
LKDTTPVEAFSGKKPNVEHLRIFGYPLYIHIPKDKRNKLEPSGKKVIFFRHSEPSKSYKIYIPKQHKIEFSKDVTFNEKMDFKKSIEESMEEEYEEPKEENTYLPKIQNEEPRQFDHPMQPCEPIESIIVRKTRKHPTWIESTLPEVERLKAPSGTFIERKNPKRFSSYATFMTKLINE